MIIANDLLANSGKLIQIFFHNFSFPGGQTDFWKTYPIYAEISISATSQTDFWKNHPYLVEAWMRFPEGILSNRKKFKNHIPLVEFETIKIGHISVSLYSVEFLHRWRYTSHCRHYWR